mmetsp:Transcript_21620/g.49810  ORF Transcript_21620/g.49810 Transcript_21620/m.49810 type:complete len:222 (-) Transcript_21620:236-901(-)|eukprot:CAMPEP_0182558670 /NCGR_PEP_ID=MMETSP1324-20130603/2087_1 /TAXON_ID=236786 /ORGANISM="Florenciella sp., Strain RCC1587" /LENGTH=221 /DNA_ID=CAMNT_0024770855 /DNA_START=109 /DNA_END=774 /DNA_ORIENTATION=+
MAFSLDLEARLPTDILRYVRSFLPRNDTAQIVHTAGKNNELGLRYLRNFQFSAGNRRLVWSQLAPSTLGSDQYGDVHRITRHRISAGELQRLQKGSTLAGERHRSLEHHDAAHDHASNLAPFPFDDVWDLFDLRPDLPLSEVEADADDLELAEAEAALAAHTNAMVAQTGSLVADADALLAQADVALAQTGDIEVTDDDMHDPELLAELVAVDLELAYLII